MVTSSRQDPIVMIYSEWNSLRLARTMWTSVKIQDGFSMVLRVDSINSWVQGSSNRTGCQFARYMGIKPYILELEQ